MKSFRIFLLLVASASLGMALSSYNYEVNRAAKPFPYRQAGLTQRQAAAHLVSRFTYGATPKQIDEVVHMGLEKWFAQQLAGDLNDTALNKRLTNYDAINLSNADVVKTYLKNGELLRMAIKNGVIPKDSVAQAGKQQYKTVLNTYMKENGFKPQQDLFRQFINQKIIRAAYSNNQLTEVLTDFWFNHFNVSITKAQCAEFIPAYERDVIRPNVNGKFRSLLVATAKSPAMLYFLDNFSSTGANTAPTANGAKNGLTPKNNKGLNENYAREIMELHTLGVDGGYTQQDVTEAARVLTGWTVYPMGRYGAKNALQNTLNKGNKPALIKRGFVFDGDFLFVPTRHDKGAKTIMGNQFPAGVGYEEGVRLLNILAQHPATARFISTKLATRFVSDQPPPELIKKMARTFTDSDGDIKQVLLTMVNAPEFWSKEAVREKTKSPFELAISTVRSLNADIQQPYQLYNWITRMGQKMYYYQAPTGFPDNGQYWINTGSLLNRMNFGLSIAAQRIPGVKINLSALNNQQEPESAEAALRTYSALILPERELTATVKRLTPMLGDQRLSEKINKAAQEKKSPLQDQPMYKQASAGNAAVLAQVVGIIIGSPEFQRK